MSERWVMTIVNDNTGKPLSVWSLGDYELCQNVNLGRDGGWVFELTLSGKRVGLFGTLAAGKQGARDHSEGHHLHDDGAQRDETAA